MADQLVAQLGGDTLLQLFDLLVGELDHAAGLDIDQMVVVIVLGLFIARAAIAEIVALQDARLFEEAHGAVDGGEGNAGIDLGGALMQQLDVRMILRFGEYAGDDPTLVGHLQPLFDAQPFQP